MFGKTVVRPTVFPPRLSPWWSCSHSRLADFAPFYCTQVESSNGFDKESASGSKGPGEEPGGLGSLHVSRGSALTGFVRTLLFVLKLKAKEDLGLEL